MFSSVLSAAILGMEILPVRVEADVSDGLPSFSMVGYVSSQVKEAQDRVRTALRNSKIALPPKKITVNLAPADVRKEGAGFDLPVAGAVLTSMGYIPKDRMENIMMLGELSLNGEIHGVSGILPSVMKAREMGCSACVIPSANRKEGLLVKDIPIIGVSTLEEMLEKLNSPNPFVMEENVWSPDETPCVYDTDFSDIRGQENLKRAAVVAACGLHNLLLIGVPGAGKTMIARRIPTIMPNLTMEESLEITKIYSIAGLLPHDSPVMRIRPFRSPHHTTSAKALAGGGKIPKPGEVTLAHRSVLFLDELPEFSKSSLEVLRQPMEDRCIHLSRVQGTYTFPADFMLVAAMNPCPCGYYPDMNRCRCTQQEIHRYLKKISQPLLDRMDICVEAPAVSWQEMTGQKRGETSAQIREVVTRTQKIQQERYRGTDIHFNSDMGAKEVEQYCVMNARGKEMIQKAFTGLSLSARGYHRVLKVARTIADMEEEELITEKHIAEALTYRMIDKKYWSGS